MQNPNSIEPIIGSGGGTPTSVDATLRSNSLINFLFLLGAGEIAGFPVGENILKYIYFNNTPVMNPDGSVNFLGVTADWRSGTQTQSVMPGTYPGAETPVSVNQQVIRSFGPVVRSIVNTLATAIRVTLYCPSLQRSDNQGIIYYSSIEFKIYISSNGGAFVLKVNDKFEGRTAGGYARDYTLDVRDLPPPWSIKVERVSPDIPPTNTLEQNSLYWQTYTTILQEQFVYPNSALLYVSIDTTYFNSQPTCSVLLMGWICSIPSNYNPIARVYTGIWDGTWSRAYTNNPIWLLLKLLTDPIDGLGNRIKLEQIDKWSFYAAARYCDEMVSDGYGGQEPRHTFNYYMTERKDALQQIQLILSQVRGIAYYAGGLIFIELDRPGVLPSALFNETDTVREYDEEGRLSQPPFTYDYVSLKQRHAIASVSWYDQNQFGKKRAARQDLHDIGFGEDFDRYGQEPIDIDLVGCTSQAEALRHARYLLATERLEAKTVLFATGDEGRIRKPSELIQLFDRHEQGARYGGRVVSATTTRIELDGEVEIGGGDTFVVMVGGVELSAIVANPAGVYDTIDLNPPLDAAPATGDVWGIIGAIQPEIYRIISAGNPAPDKYALAAILNNPAKYALADGNDELVPSSGRLLPEPPTNLVVQVVPGGYLVGWSASPSNNVVSYYLEYEPQGSNSWSQIPTAPGVTTGSVSLPSGTYVFRVRAVDIWGQYSSVLNSEPAYAVRGKIAANSTSGKAILDQPIKLLAGTTYYLQTTCIAPAGNTPSGFISPYVDRRKIVGSAGVTNELTVLPSYMGEYTNLISQSTGLNLSYTPSYLIVSGGNLVVTTPSGTVTVPPGSYVLDAAQKAAIATATAIAVGGSAVLWQHVPGQNPVLGSDWSISTQPLEQIGDITANGGLLTV